MKQIFLFYLNEQNNQNISNMKSLSCSNCFLIIKYSDQKKMNNKIILQLESHGFTCIAKF
jgi:hypothetical protein